MASKPFDVIVVGSGVAGALVAYRLARANVRVLILEAGGIVPDSINRTELVRAYVRSPAKDADSPYTTFDTVYTAPQPLDEPPADSSYYDQDVNKTPFKSYYERIAGGSTWHWQGICIRMFPNDFRMKSRYGIGVDWPLSYDDLEPWYSDAEQEIGVAGSDLEALSLYEKRFGAYRSRPFPMPEIAPSYLDRQFAAALAGKRFTYRGTTVPLLVTTVPQAHNSREYDGRPVCDGHGTCVPLCPIKAKYEAVFHLEKALAAGAVLREKAIVTGLKAEGGRISRVVYKTWDGQEQSEPVRVLVLAANGIETPKILLMSGGVANSSDNVGRYLMDHPIKSSYGLAGSPVYPFRGPQTTSDIAVLRDGDFRRSWAAFKTSLKNDGWATANGAPRGSTDDPMKIKGDPRDRNRAGTILDLVHNMNLFGSELKETIASHANREIVLNSATEMLPYRDSRVTLSAKTDRFGMPRPKIDFQVDDDTTNYTRKSFQAIIALHQRIFQEMRATSVQLNNEEVDDPRKPLQYFGSGHIMGTTRMGDDPRASVVDKDCRSWDHGNLFMLGSNVFPTSSTANPVLTIAALALRAAETIRATLGVF